MGKAPCETRVLIFAIVVGKTVSEAVSGMTERREVVADSPDSGEVEPERNAFF